MITNLKDFPYIHYYMCKKPLMEYLVFKCGLTTLGYDGFYYYFPHSQEVEKCIKKAPILVKIKELLEK